MSEVKVARLPLWLEQRGWQVTSGKDRSRGYGYLRYKSRKRNSKIPFGARAHRYVAERIVLDELSMWEGVTGPIATMRRKLLESMLLDGKLHPDFAVHHQDSDKLHCCGENLIIMHPSLNPAGPVRDPYTGKRMTVAAFVRSYD